MYNSKIRNYQSNFCRLTSKLSYLYPITFIVYSSHTIPLFIQCILNYLIQKYYLHILAGKFKIFQKMKLIINLD